MSRQTHRMKGLSGLLAVYLFLLMIHVPVSLAAEAQLSRTIETGYMSSPTSSTTYVQSYVDVPDQAWYAETVNGWIALGILMPKEGDRFGPNFVITRGDFAFLLAYSLGLAPSSKTSVYKDLAVHEQVGYITVLQETGILNGYPDGTFRPNSPVTRAEAASWIATAKKLHPEPQSSSLFRDVSPKSWYSGAIGALVKAGIISGKSKNRFAPTDSVSRAETIALLDRAFFSPSVIQDIRDDGTIMIDGRAFRADESVKGIFQSSNKAILHNAAIQFTHNGNAIVSVEILMIGYKGALAGVEEPHEFNAGGNTINGTVMLDADHTTLANLEVKGDLLLGRGFKTEFFADKVLVRGKTIYLEDFGRPKAHVANLKYQMSDLGMLVLANSTNVRRANIEPDTSSNTSIYPTKAVRVSALASLDLPPMKPILPPMNPSLPSTVPSLPTGLHLSVTDGAIVVTNPGGSLGFQASQFGYVPNIYQPPVIVPSNPNIMFQPPPGATLNSSNSNEEIPRIDDNSPTSITCENVNCNVEAFVDTQMDTGGTGTIDTITVHSGVNFEYLSNETIQEVILGDPDSTGDVSFTGTANIEHVTVNGTGGSITLNTQGAIGTLETTGRSQLVLQSFATIGNLIVPPSLDPRSLFTNTSDLSRVSSIGGVRTEAFCSLNPSDPSCQVSSPPTTPAGNYPILKSIVDEALTSGSAQFRITTTYTDILYYVLLPSGQPAPSVLQVMHGRDATDQDVEVGNTGIVDVEKGGGSTIFFLELNSSTSYTLYVVGERINTGGLSAVKQRIFTTADITPEDDDNDNFN